MYFSSLRCSLPLHRWKFVQNSVEKYVGETLKLSFFLSFFFAITGSFSKPSEVCIHKTDLPKIIFRTKSIIFGEVSFEKLISNILRARCLIIQHLEIEFIYYDYSILPKVSRLVSSQPKRLNLPSYHTILLERAKRFHEMPSNDFCLR